MTVPSFAHVDSTWRPSSDMIQAFVHNRLSELSIAGQGDRDTFDLVLADAATNSSNWSDNFSKQFRKATNVKGDSRIPLGDDAESKESRLRAVKQATNASILSVAKQWKNSKDPTTLLRGMALRHKVRTDFPKGDHDEKSHAVWSELVDTWLSAEKLSAMPGCTIDENHRTAARRSEAASSGSSWTKTLTRVGMGLALTYVLSKLVTRGEEREDEEW